MDDRELEVGMDLMMSHKRVFAIGSADGEITFWHRGLHYTFFDLASLVEWFNDN